MIKSAPNRNWFLLPILLIVCVFISKLYLSNDRAKTVIWADQEGYFIYLPALIIHHGFTDVPCTNGCTFLESERGTQTFTKYTYGVALLQSPFFLIANWLAPILDFERDGKSAPYIWSIILAAIFYMLGGLWLLAKLLSEIGTKKLLSWLIPVGVLLGTNLFHYTFREPGMSHVYSFFLMSLLIYSVHKRKDSNWFGWLFFSAVSLALIVLVRPTNIIAGCIPLLWGVSGIKDIKANLKAYFGNPKWILLFCFWLALLFIPQIAYWKSLTGDYLFYSYGNEGFTNWNQPQMLKVLFSPQNGWLIYSPVALLSLLGMALMVVKKEKGWVLPILLISLATYVFGSWWAWWFGGAYGHRCFVDFLPVLVIPTVYASSHINTLSKWLARACFSLFVIAAFVNLRMSYIYEGMWDGPGWGWYNYIDKLKEAVLWF